MTHIYGSTCFVILTLNLDSFYLRWIDTWILCRRPIAIRPITKPWTKHNHTVSSLSVTSLGDRPIRALVLFTQQSKLCANMRRMHLLKCLVNIWAISCGQADMRDLLVAYPVIGIHGSIYNAIMNNICVLTSSKGEWGGGGVFIVKKCFEF